MRLRPRLRRPGIQVVCLVGSALFVVAGCSTGGPAGDVSSSSEARPIAARAALKLADVGSEWRASPDTPQATDGADLQACAGGTKLTTEALATGKRNVFAQGADVSHIAEVIQQATVIRSRSIDQVAQELGPSRLEACLKEHLPARPASGQRFDVDHMTVQKVDIDRSDHATLVSLPVTAVVQQSTSSSNAAPTSTTTEVPGTIVFLIAQRGQVVSSLAVMSFGISVSREQIVDWASTVVARAA